VFVINDPVYDNAAGQIEDVSVKNLILFKNRNNYTICHETLHGLGLYHTHRDGTIKESNRKFVYKDARVDPTHATDNIMSYNGSLRKSTWKWQWNIIRKNL
ncbi:hypothetical protein V3I07_14470, partial [Flavobacterium oreochromis]